MKSILVFCALLASVGAHAQICCTSDGRLCNGSTCFDAADMPPWYDRGASVVRVVGCDAGGLNNGTGVYLGNGWVLTAAHNLRGNVRTKVQDSRGQWHPVARIEADGEADIALVQTCKLSIPSVPIGNDPPATATTGFAGFPRNTRFACWTTRPLMGRDFGHLAAYEGNTTQGVSGGPMMFEGRCVGIVVHGTPNGDPDKMVLAVRPGPIRRFIRRVLGPRGEQTMCVAVSPANTPAPMVQLPQRGPFPPKPVDVDTIAPSLPSTFVQQDPTTSGEHDYSTFGELDPLPAAVSDREAQEPREETLIATIEEKVTERLPAAAAGVETAAKVYAWTNMIGPAGGLVAVAAGLWAVWRTRKHKTSSPVHPAPGGSESGAGLGGPAPDDGFRSHREV